jgi:hypothetical protein
MSAIAFFTKVPKTALGGLRNAAPKGSSDAYLKANGRKVAEYRWSGYVLATLLVYLQEKFQIDLMKSEHDELNTFLTEATGATHFIFTTAQKEAFLSWLAPNLFSEDEMCQYFNEFHATNEQGIGRAMLDGIRSLRQSLEEIDHESVVVFSVA